MSRVVEEIEVVKVSRLVKVIWVVRVIIDEILIPISTQMMADMIA